MKNKITKIKFIILFLSMVVTSIASAQITNNSVSDSQIICEGAKPAMFNGSLPSGGLGSYNYHWQWSQTSDNDGFTDIVSANSQDYQATSLTVTTWFRRVADDGSIGDTSAAIEVTVNPMPVADARVNDEAQCFKGNSFSFSDFSIISSGSYTLSWDFGDGNNDTIASPAHSYTATGSYTASLMLTSDMGCMDTSSLNLIVNPAVSVLLSVNKTSDCFNGNRFIFADSSTVSSGNYTRKWEFGDGNSSNASITVHSYTNSGMYTANLITTSDSGCMDTATINLSVNPYPVVNAIVNNKLQCFKGNNFIYKDSSTISSGTYTREWDFGDGTKDTSANPSHSYNSDGIYNGTLTITSDKGCTIIDNWSITVNPMPVADAFVAKDNQCFKDNNFSLLDFSSISSGSYTIDWEFGDGNTDTIANISHSYGIDGSYAVNLIATSDMGCVDTSTINVTVNPMPNSVAWVNNESQCYNQNSFSFLDFSIISSGSYTLSWDFGDGNNDTIASPTHSYTATGSYTASLILTSDMGCMDTSSLNLIVNPAVSVLLSVNKTSDCLNGNSFIFVDSSTVSSGNYTPKWEFGDGNSSAGSTIVHSYTNSGMYTANLITTSDSGCMDTAKINLSVNPSPVVNAIVNNKLQCFKGNNFIYKDSSTISSGTYTREWDFGDGTKDTFANPSHVYLADGAYTNSLTLISDQGCTSTVSWSVTVNPTPNVVAWVNLDTQCFKGNNFSFADFSSISSGSYTIDWEFGDGLADTAASPTHGYAADGPYNVNLILTSDMGCKDSSTLDILVAPMPNAVAWVNNESQCYNQNSFSFLDFSSISSGSYTLSWDFGDGNFDTATSPVHNYSSTGIYTASLILTSDMGCMDTNSLDVWVNPSSSPKLNVNSTSSCFAGNSFTFTDSSTLASGSYTRLWDYGDGATDTATMPTYNYSNSGDYTASLIITTDSGCVDTATVNITVNPDPSVYAWISNTSQCLKGNSFDYIDSTTIASGSFTREWDFGDGTKDTSANPSHSYKSDGLYNGTLTVTSDKGCTIVDNWSITINPMPLAVAWVSNDTQCFKGNDFSFADFSSIPAGSYSVLWDFGDGGSDTLANPSHSYNAEGPYTTNLIATSDMGCVDTSSLNISVSVMPKSVAWVNNENQCFSQNNFSFLDFSSISSGSYTVYWEFGDGTNDTISSPVHTYSAEGSYTPNLILTSDMGCIDTGSLAILVNPSVKLSLYASNTSECFKGNSFTFTDSSTLTAGSYARMWDYGDGTMDTVATRNYSYSNYGVYDAMLISTTDSGCVDTATVKISVNPEPSAKISSNMMSACLNGNNFMFTDSSSIAMGSYTRMWDYGDGNTDTAAMPMHTYTKEGNYMVSLKLTSNGGCTDSVAIAISVIPSPKAILKVNNTSQCIVGNSFNFKDSGSISSGSYTRLWNFGNGITDTAATTNITYPKAGIYNISLTLTSDKGCSELTTISVNVNPTPTAIITANGPTTFCTGGSSFLMANTGLGYTYQWKRNGAAIAGGIDSMLLVSTSGSYTVVISNVSGCSASSNAIAVTVNAKQSLGAITGNSTVNVPNVETYSVPFVNGLYYTWIVSGGNIISGQGANAIQVQWSKIGTGFVKVVGSCYDTSVLNISIPNGIANATIGKVEIFPNPTNGSITIKLPEANVYNMIRIFDLTGKLVLTHNLNGEKQLNMNLESYSNGIYMIEMIGKDAIIQEKIVVSH